jgi:hypothetical protein
MTKITPYRLTVEQDLATRSRREIQEGNFKRDNSDQ